jgi:uncharacterized protein YkwD
MKFLRAAVFLLAMPLALRADEAGRRILAEVNFARTQPQAYAQILAEHASARHSGAVSEAVRFLEKAAPLPPLTYSPGLAQAALSHVNDQGASGQTGHRGSDGSRCFHRISRYGQWLEAIGENISYGRGGSRSTVIRLIVDEGVRDRGHRLNLFSRTFHVAGIAVGPHARYGAMCVMDFAGGFVERSEGFAGR